MAAATRVTASGLVFSGACVLLGVTVAGGADASVVHVRDGTTAAGGIKATVNSGIVGMGSFLASEGIDMSLGIYVELVSGTTPGITVEYSA